MDLTAALRTSEPPRCCSAQTLDHRDEVCTGSWDGCSRGAMVLGTGGFTYDRFVSDASQCAIKQTTEPAWVPGADTPPALLLSRCASQAQRSPRDSYIGCVHTT